MKTSRQDIRLTVLVVIIAFFIIGLIVTAVEDKSVVLNGYSAVFYCAAIAIGVQWLAWLPSSLKQTERFYDIVGGLTYLAIIGFSLWAGSQTESPSAREWIISLLVAIWSFRLSCFLFIRIHRAGKDGRFDDLKTSPTRFLVPWTVQGLWVFITMNVVIVINNQASSAPPLGIWDAIGLIVWILGFGIEVIADNQKGLLMGNQIIEGNGLMKDCGHYLAIRITWERFFFGVELPALEYPVLLDLRELPGFPLYSSICSSPRLAESQF